MRERLVSHFPCSAKDSALREHWDSKRQSPWLVRLAVLVCLVSPAHAIAQTAPSGPFTLNDAVQAALKNYPAIKERRARAQAADEGVGVARTAYLPRLDMLWQENRATTNNVFGLLLPQGVVPPISGPVLGTRSYNAVWGSAAGVLLSWEAIDFGQRKATVDVARAQLSLARAQTALTELDAASAAADAFLTVLAADESVRAARANVDRLQVFADAVRTLVQNQLRPGADQSRAEAELAVARNQLSQAIQVADLARASLADAIGAAGAPVELVVGALATVPEVAVEPPNLKSHPAARAGQANVDAVRARERALDRAYFPQVALQSAFAGRGSDADVPGQPSLGNGAWLHVPNWAIGASVTFPAFDIFAINARKRVEVQNELAENARYQQTIQSLTTQDARARALMKAAADIARNTPVERQAATDAESRARARYQTGLANITEVAEAQRLLAQAEADDAVARLGVWRALLAAAQTRGDLAPFLAKTRQP
jgi:outer membrane protein